jgi:hypothetical protein
MKTTLVTGFLPFAPFQHVIHHKHQWQAFCQEHPDEQPQQELAEHHRQPAVSVRHTMIIGKVPVISQLDYSQACSNRSPAR